jgi:hypothetical protein
MIASAAKASAIKVRLDTRAIMGVGSAPVASEASNIITGKKNFSRSNHIRELER